MKTEIKNSLLIMDYIETYVEMVKVQIKEETLREQLIKRLEMSEEELKQVQDMARKKIEGK